MTEKEAMGYLQTLANRIPLKFYTDKGLQIYDDFSQVAIKALEKQIPIKPFKDNEVPKLDFCKCGTEVTDCKYCPNCGQAIKWDD